MTVRVSQYRLQRRVHFYEVDAAGIVHFSNYFRYLEEAEHALWRQAGLSIFAAGHLVGFPRVAVSFDYHQPLRFEDEFEVSIRITAMTEKAIRYACELTRGATRIASGAATVVCVSGQPMKAVPIPADIAARFEVATATDGGDRP